MEPLQSATLPDARPARRDGIRAEMSLGEPLGATPDGGTFGLRASRRSARGWLLAHRGWLGVSGLLVTGLVICLAAAGTNLLLPRSLRPVPSWLAGPFGAIGLHLGLGVLIAMFVLMFVAYVAATLSTDQLSPRAVLISIAALHALVLLAPPLLSTDIFSYGAYGRMGALYGANPYLSGPSAIQLDFLYPLVGSQWVHTPTAYGPLFTALSYPLAPLDIPASVFAYKAIAAISSLVIVVGLWKVARLRGLDPVKAVALVGFNPVMVIYGVGGGHNDLLMVALLVTGVWALLKRRERSSGALIVAAMAIKLTAVLLLPFALAEGAGRRAAGRRAENHGRRGVLSGAGVAAAVIAALAFILFGTGPLHLVGTLLKIQTQGGLHSVPGFILTAVGLGQFGTAAGIVLGVGFVASCFWLLRRVWFGELDWITGAGWAMVTLLLTTGFLLPWYAVWVLPFAAVSADRRLRLIAIMITGLALTSL